MKRPNLNEEKKLWKKGFKFVVGLDEAGRGPLAGPVTAAAVIVKNPKHEIRNPKQIQSSKFKSSKRVSNFDRTLRGIRLRASNRISDLKIRDSKQLSAKQREKIYKKLVMCEDIEWGVGIVSEKMIDKINILEATKLAMQKALCDANIRMHTNYTNKKIDYLLLDGNFSIKSEILQKSIVKGDEKVFSCCADGFKVLL